MGVLHSTRIRSREIYGSARPGEVIGHSKIYHGTTHQILTEGDILMDGDMVKVLREWCADEVHPYPYHETGPLLLQTTRKDPGSLTVTIGGPMAGGYIAEYNGLITVYFLGDHPLSLEKPSDSYGDTSSAGPEAWNRFKPGKPAMQLGVFLGELKDMPRMLADLKSKCAALRAMRGKIPWNKFKLSNEFLSYQMAWKPFVSDLFSMSQKFFDWRARLAKLQRESNKWIRKSGSLTAGTPEISDRQEGVSYGAIMPGLSWPYVAGPHEWESYVSVSQRIWFAGSFKYYVPPIETRGDMVKAVCRLYGLSLTPDLVWNLTPWSWLVDWFTNAGSVISNLTDGAVDDVVARYACVMGHTITEVKQHVQCNLRINGYSVIQGLTGAKTVECKRRDVASPFGFGLSVGDLTLRQTAILAALGLRF